MLYRYIADLLHNDKQFSSLCVIGALVDSAPGSGNVRGALRALTATLGPKITPVLRYVLLALFAVTVFLLRVVLYPLTKYIHKNHYDAVQERPPAWPHFYLYSRADQVIRHTDIKVFVETLKQKGVPVDSFDFVSSPHVGHFRDFPEQYALKCRSFLVACMKDLEGNETKKRQRVPNQWNSERSSHDFANPLLSCLAKKIRQTLVFLSGLKNRLENEADIFFARLLEFEQN